MSDEGEPDEEELIYLVAQACIFTARPDQGRHDGGLPLNGLDRLRMLAVLGRLGTPDDEAAARLGLCPGAFAFGSRIVLALAADGRLEDVVGPLPPERINPEEDRA